MRYYITTKQNTPLIHHIICAENIGMDPVVPCLFDDFFAAFLTKSGACRVGTAANGLKGECLKDRMLIVTALGCRVDLIFGRMYS